MIDIDLKLLRFFVTAVDCATFTAAANKLGVTQPALSQGIKRLEYLVGTELIERSPQGSPRPFRTTEAGELLYKDASDLLNQAQGILKRIRANSKKTTLRVGFGTSTPSVLTQTLLSLSTSFSAIDVQLKFLEWGEEFEALRNGDVDITFTCLHNPQQEGWEIQLLMEVPRLAVFSHNHPLANAPSLTLNDIEDEPIVDAHSDREFWIIDPRPSGRSPKTVGPRAKTVDEMLTFVATGLGMGITDTTVAEKHAWPNLKYVPLLDIAPMHMCLASPQYSDRPTLSKFLSEFKMRCEALKTQ